MAMTLVADLESVVHAAVRESPSFSGVVSIRRSGEPILERAFGFAQQRERIPNRVDMRFGTASGCKIFTAVAVQQLIEEGRFAARTPLCEVLEVAYRLDPAITVGHLLAHNSGLPDYYDEEELSEAACRELMAEHARTLLSPEAYLPLFLHRAAKFPAGERFHYNNGAFVLLALLVEQQDGRSFPDSIRDRIFEPAGMSGAGYFRMDGLPPQTSHGYTRQRDGSLHSNASALPMIGSGDGGAFVSARDWARFWEALCDRRLLGEEATRSMLRPQASPGPKAPDRHYGYGVWLLLRSGETYGYYVEGADFGVGMFSGVFPSAEMQITVLDNHGDAGGRVWNAILRALPEPG